MELEVFTDSEILRSYFNKLQINRRDGQWLEFLRISGMSSLTLVKRKVHILLYVLSRIPKYASPNISAANSLIKEEAIFKAPSRFMENHNNDTTFGPTYQSL